MSTILPRNGYVTHILSGHLTTKTAHESNLAHIGLAHDLAQLLAHGCIDTFAHCRGAYKGEPEQSIAVIGASGCESLRIIVQELGNKYGQESILAIDHHGQGKLYFGITRSYSNIGTYQAIDSTNGVDAWTEVCATGETFTFI